MAAKKSLRRPRMKSFSEILYQKRDRVATITINRLKQYNACLPTTIGELTQAFVDAWAVGSIGVMVFTGAGDKAFCTGEDQSVRRKGGDNANVEEYAGRIVSLPLEVGWQVVTFLIRHIPKPVIARVNDYAIGGGHVWQVNCVSQSRPRQPNSDKLDQRLEASTQASVLESCGGILESRKLGNYGTYAEFTQQTKH